MARVGSAALVAALVLAGCASTHGPSEPTSIRATEDQVSGCEFLGEITAVGRKTSLIGGAESRTEAAHRNVATEADALGGTHYVVRGADTRFSWHVACGFFCGDKMEIIAGVYRCTDPEA